MIQVKVYEYFGIHRIRTYIFLIGQDYISSIRIMGRKRVNLIKLFKKTKLEKRNPDDEFLMPDKEYNLYLMGDWVIQIWEYKWEDYIGLIFRFRDFWSNEVKVSKHKRVCYKRIFYATPLYEIREDQKMMSPTRTMTEIVSGERLKEKGCL